MQAEGYGGNGGPLYGRETPVPLDPPDVMRVIAWARLNGLDCPARDPLPSHLFDAYRKEH